MSRNHTLILFIPVLLFILACQTLTKPFDTGRNMAATAGAIGTDAIRVGTEFAPLATAFAEPTQGAIPVPSGEPLGTPDMGDLFNPQGQPLSSWNGIPVMPEALAGEELDTIYSYRVPAPAADVRAFYDAQLPPLGWSTLFSGDLPIYIYTKEDSTLSITIAEQDNGTIVLLSME
jgi:hypothetical protein